MEEEEEKEKGHEKERVRQRSLRRRKLLPPFSARRMARLTRKVSVSRQRWTTGRGVRCLGRTPVRPASGGWAPVPQK